METLEMARENASIDSVQVWHKPRLLSDNVPCYLSRESLDNLTPADVYFGRKRVRLNGRDIIKRETMKLRRAYNMGKGGLKKYLLLGKSTP